MTDTDGSRIRRAGDGDAAAIADIYNEAILTTTSTFDTEPKSVEERLAWLGQHDDRHPVYVLEVDGRVAGWASLTAWSDRTAYAGTAETSFFVHSEFHGRGYGKRLKFALVDAAREIGLHTLIARVAEGSDASVHICRQAGFERIGTMKQVGYKFDRYLDVDVFQLLL